MRFASHAELRGLDGDWAQLTYLAWMQQPLNVSLRLLVRAGAMLPRVASARLSSSLRFLLLQQASRHGGVVSDVPAVRDGVDGVVKLLAQSLAATSTAPQMGGQAWGKVVSGNVSRRDALHRLLALLPQAFRAERRMAGREAFSALPEYAGDALSNPAFRLESGTAGIYSRRMMQMPSLAWMSASASASPAAGAMTPATMVLASMARPVSASESRLATWLKTLRERTDLRTGRSRAARTASSWSKVLHSLQGSVPAWRSPVPRSVMLDQHEAARQDVRSRAAVHFTSVGRHSIRPRIAFSPSSSTTPVTDRPATDTQASLHVSVNGMRFVIADAAGSMRSFTTENLTSLRSTSSSAANTVLVYRATPLASPSPVAIQRQIERIGQQVTRRVVHEMVPQVPSLEQMEQAVLAPRVVRELTRQVASMMSQRVSLERYRRGL